MKGIVSILICASLLFSANSHSVFAINADNRQWEAFADSWEERGGAFVSLLSRFFNKLFRTDESEIDTAAPSNASWEEFDGTGFVENPEAALDAEAWVMKELTFVSDKIYDDPFNAVDAV